MRRFYAESTASELAWNDCPEFGHLRLCNHSPDIPLVRRCDPHTPSYIKSGYQRSRASLPTAAALLVSSPNLEHGVPGGQESAPDLPSGLRYLSPSLPGVRGRPPSSPATPVRPHEPPAHPRAPAARHTSPPQSVPRSSLSPRPTPIPPHEHETTTTPTNSTPSPSQLPLAPLLCSSARSQRIRIEQPGPLSSTSQSSESHDGIETSRSSSEPDSGERPDGVGWRQARSGRTA